MLPSIDPHTLSVVVRGIHVAAMSVLVGGGALACFYLMRPGFGAERVDPGNTVHLLKAYELLFWLAVGLLVMTGIGNLATFGAGLPSATSSWGQRLLIKLVLVAVFILASVPRTLLVTGIGRAGSELASDDFWMVLRAAYAATLVLAFGLLAVAVVLAHG